MRLIRRVVLLTFLVVAGTAAFNYGSENGWTLRSGAAALEAKIAKQQAARLASNAADRARDAASKVGHTVGDRALTAKIKSKMVLDDRVKARAIDIDTSGAVVTLTGIVQSADERERAVRLAQETEGVTKVVDKLQVRTPALVNGQSW